MANDRQTGKDGDAMFCARCRIVAGVVAMLVVALASSACAQQYQADPVDENAGKLKLLAEQCVKNPARYATDRGQFNEYFEKYFFPAMTRFGPNDLAQIGRNRDDLFSRFLWASTDENLQSELTQMALAKLWPIAPSSKYHPAVRYNAVLIIGKLDKTYAAPGRPPVPLKEGFEKLHLILNSAIQGKSVPPFLVVGALVGLERHAQLRDALDRDTIEKMTSVAQQITTQDDLFPDVEPKVDEWIRLQAASVLANLRSPGPKGEVTASLAKLIAGETKPKMSIDARGQVAALLKKFNYQGATVDGKVMSDALLQLALDVGDDEKKEAIAFEEAQLQGGGFGGSFGGAAGGPRSKRMKLDLETQMWEYNPNVLLSRLTDLSAGLQAFRPLAPADKQPIFDAVLAAMRPADSAARSSDTVDLTVAQRVREMGEQIRAAIKPGSEAPESNEAELF